MEVIGKLGAALLRQVDTSYSTSPTWTLVVVFFFLVLVVGFLGGCLFILVVQKLSSKHIELLLRALVATQQAPVQQISAGDRRVQRPVILEDFELHERDYRETPARTREVRTIVQPRRTSARDVRVQKTEVRSDEEDLRRRVQSLS